MSAIATLKLLGRMRRREAQREIAALPKRLGPRGASAALAPQG